MNQSFDKAVNNFLNLYANFTSKNENQSNIVNLEGRIDIIDINGNYWDSFDIRISIQKSNYPFIIPRVFEISKVIEREDDWHIGIDDECCLDITHNLILLQSIGIDLVTFYQTKIYSFFANYLYKKETGEYANGDYPHLFEGVKHYYDYKLGLSDTELIIKLLNCIIENKVPKRFKLCICGKKKFKNCHLNTIESLKKYGIKQLEEDLKGFMKIYTGDIIL